MNSRHFLSTCLALLLMTLVMAGAAQASLIITPMRFVFEDKTRSLKLLLLNGDNTAHTYRIGWKMMRMDEVGEYHDLTPEETGSLIVPKMVVFSPRQVTLAPGAQQNVNLSLRRPADLPPGEYRGHILFEDVTPSPEKPPSKSEGSDMKINVRLSFTAPVIVRAGNLQPGAVGIASPKLQRDSNGQAVLNLDLTHTPGQSSVYGKVIVKAKDKEIGILNNVALYPEVAKRIVNVPLNAVPGGSVEISYVGAGEYKGKTFASQQVTLAQ